MMTVLLNRDDFSIFVEHHDDGVVDIQLLVS